MSAPNPPPTHLEADAVSPEDVLLDLLDRWEEARRAGRDPTAEELCPDSPTLQAELRERIRRRRRVDALLATCEQPITESSLPTVAGYEVLAELGRGGMGVVYRARHLGLNRVVALKMLLGGGRADPESRQRFRTEAEAVARLQHPNIVQIHDVGFHDEQPYLALEYLDGGSLAERTAGNPQSPRDAAAITAILARAVQHAHERGVVHRDLKPANVLCESGPDALPRLKVSDFGLAKQLDVADGRTRTGAVLGTPSYMAPEQADGRTRDIGPGTDVWALGVILYELLTGRPPFKSASLTETFDLIRKQEPVPIRRLQPKTPRDLETICLKCLHKEPGRRFRTAGELADDLERFLDGKPITSRPVSTTERAIKWTRRNPAVAGLIVVSVVAVVGLGGLGIVYNIRITQERDEAREQRGKAERALALAVQSGAVLDNLGMKFYERNRQDKTEETFQMAADAMTQNLKLLEAMVLEAPDNREVRAALGLSYQNRGDLYAARGKLEESEKDLRRALTEWDTLAAAQALPRELRYRRAITRIVLARMLFYVRNDPDEALTFCDETIPILESAIKDKDAPVMARYKLTEAYVIRASVHLQHQRTAEALADWDRVLADPTLGPGELRFKYEFNWAYVAARVGRRIEAAKAAEKLRRNRAFQNDYFRDLAEIYALCAAGAREEDGYATRAIACLTEAVDTGHLKGEEDVQYLTTSPDLASLRGRTEFESIVAKLRKR